METEEEEIMEVFQWLEKKYFVTVDVDWLVACISWLKQQPTIKTETAQQLKEKVCLQWLVSDLQDSGSACLPPELIKAEETHIKRFLALQMNYVADISQSAYSQLMKLQGKQKSEDEPKGREREPKANRMLSLELTDGSQIVKGMEYSPIKQLHADLPPGTKVLIKKNTICRRGVLFLTEDNIKILGGHVDSLVEQNSQLNVLNRLVTEAKHGLKEGKGNDVVLFRTQFGKPGEPFRSSSDNASFSKQGLSARSTKRSLKDIKPSTLSTKSSCLWTEYEECDTEINDDALCTYMNQNEPFFTAATNSHHTDTENLQNAQQTSQGCVFDELDDLPDDFLESVKETELLI